MVCTANDLLEWKDFPKGLRILLFNEDKNSAAEIKSKLEKMEYIVVACSSEHEAFSAISAKNESFHIAIVEVSLHNRDERCNFLEIAKDLPTVMISKEHCLNTMMNCIALGAVEFLIEPLSEEKLRNIWQHVVHKAFNTSGSEKSESPNSINEFVGSILEIQQQNIATQSQISEKPMINVEGNQGDRDQSIGGDKFPAPSTPQLKQSGRSLDVGNSQDQSNNSSVKEVGEFDGETKSVDNTYNGDSFANMEVDPPLPTSIVAIKEEEDHSDGLRGTDNSVLKPHDKKDATVNNGNSERVSTQSLSGSKGSHKKLKVDWTPDLHKKFVQAVEQLGVDQAIPSRILELMDIEGLTRHNIASHLQKYRMHRRHISPKQGERRWPHPRDSTTKNYYPHHNLMMAYHPYHTGHTFASAQVYPMWGQQGCHPPGFPMWAPLGYPWQPYSAMHADAWGCPVIPHPAYPPLTFPQTQGAYRFHSPGCYGKHSADTNNPGQELIDKVVKEVINKPWLPLPLGLKPPSTDSVLAELSRQGVSTMTNNFSNHHPC